MSRHTLVRPRSWRRRPFQLVTILLGSALAFLVVRENQPDHRREHVWPWNVELLSDEAMAGLFVASLGWVLLRERRSAVEPRLGYESFWITESEFLVEDAKYRRVVIAIKGRGPAVFQRVSWDVHLVGDGAAVRVESMAVLHALLAERGIVEGNDFALANLSQGAPRDPDDQIVYLECTATALARFHTFRATFDFTSSGGDLYRDEISLLPHEGAPSAAGSPPDEQP